MKGRLGIAKIREEMLTYFKNFSDASGAPSFAKFRRGIGLSLSDFEKLKGKRSFHEALKECSEFRRDYLIDCGLTKRFDASFVKFLLQSEDESPKDDDTSPQISFEVIDDEI